MSAALKLFGKTIPLPPPPGSSDSVSVEEDAPKPEENSAAKLDVIDHKDVASPLGKSADPTRTKVENNETSASEEKNLKKPDKIIPCPRCSSMDTKFCYYNNYNVNQPRHYCKNCQRYWTAGGNMRNVPIGAGRRKGKNSESQYQCPADIVNAFHQQMYGPNIGVGTVLKFGSDNLHCKSMTSSLNLGKNAILTDYIKNGNFHISVPGGRNDTSSALALKRSHGNGNLTEIASTESNIAKFLPQVPNNPGPLWPYSWNPDRFIRQLAHSSGACPPGFPMPCHPAVEYWGCAMPGTWNTPWLNQLPSPILISQESVLVSSKLRKHPRDENILSPSKSEHDQKLKQKSLHKYLWFPKALRIGESETTKISTRETREMKSERGESTNHTGLVGTFPRHPNLSNTAMQANPAALSRSFKFRESS